jgi:hypothetical protein
VSVALVVLQQYCGGCNSWAAGSMFELQFVDVMKLDFGTQVRLGYNAAFVANLQYWAGQVGCWAVHLWLCFHQMLLPLFLQVAANEEKTDCCLCFCCCRCCRRLVGVSLTARSPSRSTHATTRCWRLSRTPPTQVCVHRPIFITSLMCYWMHCMMCFRVHSGYIVIAAVPAGGCQGRHQHRCGDLQFEQFDIRMCIFPAWCCWLLLLWAYSLDSCWWLFVLGIRGTHNRVQVFRRGRWSCGQWLVLQPAAGGSQGRHHRCGTEQQQTRHIFGCLILHHWYRRLAQACTRVSFEVVSCCAVLCNWFTHKCT